jgi:hypothetical protein
MSFGGGATTPPRLQQVNLGGGNTEGFEGPGAEELIQKQNVAQFALSDADWKARFGPLFEGRESMISELGAEIGGGIPRAATGALETAGLGAEARRIPGGSEFKTARNLNEPIRKKELRDRNYSAALLAQNPERFESATPQNVLDILTANTGNVNAYRQAVFGAESNAAVSSTLQQGQDALALSSLLSTGVLDYAKYSQSPYVSPAGALDPYSEFYGFESAPADPYAFGSATGGA